MLPWMKSDSDKMRGACLMRKTGTRTIAYISFIKKKKKKKKF